MFNATVVASKVPDNSKKSRTSYVRRNAWLVVFAGSVLFWSAVAYLVY